MFQFIKNLFGFGNSTSNELTNLPEHLKMFSVLFDSGDFEEALVFLKKYQILPKDKILEKINPHFYDYWTNSTNSAEWYEHHSNIKALKAKSNIKFYFPHHKETKIDYVIPSFIKNFILDFTFLQNTKRDNIWANKNTCKVRKNNIDTVVRCFTYISHHLLNNKFEQLKIDNVDIIYIWLDSYSFKDTEWLETYQSEDLKHFPKKVLRFGTYAAYDFKKLIADLKFLGYDVELKDGYTAAKHFFEEIEKETFK